MAHSPFSVFRTARIRNQSETDTFSINNAAPCCAMRHESGVYFLVATTTSNGVAEKNMGGNQVQFKYPIFGIEDPILGCLSAEGAPEDFGQM